MNGFGSTRCPGRCRTVQRNVDPQRRRRDRPPPRTAPPASSCGATHAPYPQDHGSPCAGEDAPPRSSASPRSVLAVRHEASASRDQEPQTTWRNQGVTHPGTMRRRYPSRRVEAPLDDVEVQAAPECCRELNRPRLLRSHATRLIRAWADRGRKIRLPLAHDGLSLPSRVAVTPPSMRMSAPVR